MLISDKELIPIVYSALARGQRISMTVNGRSMFPFIRDGDVVELEPMIREPKIGDIVLVRFSEDWCPLHRLVAHSSSGWLLRGDNNSKSDGIVKSERLIGLLSKVYRNGRSVCFARGHLGLWIAWLSRKGWLYQTTRSLYLFKRIPRTILKR